MTLVVARGPVVPSAIGRGIAVSVLAHALAVVGFVAFSRGRPAPLAPATYRVTLVAAPAGRPAPLAATSASTAAPAPIARARAAEHAPVAKPAPSHESVTHALTHSPVAAAAKPALVTPAKAVPAKAAPAKVAPAKAALPSPVPVRAAVAKPTPAKPTSTVAHAAAGPTRSPARSAKTSATATHPKSTVATIAPHADATGTGAPASRGHDVADVRVVGLEFPFPGYLDNLVRQVRVRFAPTPSRAPLHADLAFVVARDGSITSLRVVRSSGDYAFDLEAQGAVEAAGSARAFGPLPDRFQGSTLPVTFSFDPRSTP